MIVRHEIAITTNAAGGATVTSTVPYHGEVLELRMPNAGTAITATGSTADFTITRTDDGGTILALTNVNAPFTYNPRAAANSNTGGTSAYALGIGPVYDGYIPVDGNVQCVVAQAQPSVSGTVFVYVKR